MPEVSSGKRPRVFAASTLLCGLVAVLCLLAQLASPRHAHAGGNPSTELMFAQAGANATSKGDYISAGTGLNTFYTFYIEVPPSLTSFSVDVFDPDVVSNGGSLAGEPYDLAYNSKAVCKYQLLKPDGTFAASIDPASQNSPTASSGTWYNLYAQTTGTVTKGHWQLTVEMSQTYETSNSVSDALDYNAYGIRASGSISGTTKEIPVYASPFYCTGTTNTEYYANSGAGTSHSTTIYPWITSGCNFVSKNFDWDKAGSIVFTGADSVRGRTPTVESPFSYTISAASTSANDTWSSDTITGWGSDTVQQNYGIWKEQLTLNPVTGDNNNYGVVYLGNSSYSASAPTSAAEANTFRIYLPDSSGNAPKKPYVMQRIDSAPYGPNPPQSGQVSQLRIVVQVSNPTDYAVTFSSGRQVTVNVPGNGCTYAGNAKVTQGTITAQPTAVAPSSVPAPGSDSANIGNVTWNPGTVAANSFATLQYLVNVKPTSSGQRITVTNGTSARYLDETNDTINTTRSVYTFGPLCDLATTEGSVTVTLAKLNSFEAITHPGESVQLDWRTSYEVDNLGFNVYRDVNGFRTRLNPSLIQGTALQFGSGKPNPEGDSYEWWDPDTSPALYWLEDVDLHGRSTWRGPYAPRAGGPAGGAMARPRIIHLLNETDTGSPDAIFDGQRPRVGHTAGYVPPAPRVSGRTAPGNLASLPGAQFGVKTEGWYRIPQAVLVSNGIPASTDPRTLRLYADGQEVPCLITGEEDGKLGSTDSLQFYGLPVDTNYSDTHIYWVAAVGAGGLRIQGVQSPGSGTPAAGSFPFTAERHERYQYYAALHNSGGNKWFGAGVSSTALDQTLTLSHLVPGTPATLQVALQGVTQTNVCCGGTAHHVRISVNGTPIGDASYNGTDHPVVTFNLSGGVVSEGLNVVTLVADGPAPDVSVVDYIRITYAHSYTAEANTLRCTAQGGQSVSIDGFTTNHLHVADVTDPNNPSLLQVSVGGGGTDYTVGAVAPGSGVRTLFAFADEADLGPAISRANTPSKWDTPANQGQLLIITAAPFQASVAPLASLRVKKGTKAAVAVVDDVYDEFSNGQKDPGAIKRFIQYAKSSWQIPPKWVLLVGDASFDPRDYQKSGVVDYVPAMLVETSYAETASDDWFVDFNNDGLPDLGIGRLPASSATEAATMVKKITTYDSAKPSKNPAPATALFAADSRAVVDPTTPGAGVDPDFASASAQAAGVLPATITAQQLDRGKLGDSDWKSGILKAWQAGPSLVNFTGHGSVEVWTHQGLFSTGDAQSLTNGTKLPVVVSMTCLNGFFISTRQRCLAETLMINPNGGALAVWASSSLTLTPDQTPMNQAFYTKLFATPAYSLGDAAAYAKSASNNPDVRRTWILFGDPSQKLH